MTYTTETNRSFFCSSIPFCSNLAHVHAIFINEIIGVAIVMKVKSCAQRRHRCLQSVTVDRLGGKGTGA